MEGCARQFGVLLALAFVAPSGAAQGVGVLRDSENTLIGQYVERNDGPAGGTVVHSDRGFRFAIDGIGQLTMPQTDVSGASFDNSVGYGNLTCSGTGYTLVSGANAAGGIVFAGPDGFYYVAKSPQVQVVLIGSFRVGSVCTPVTPQAQLSVPVQPNNPTVTGVPNQFFIPPIRLEMVPLSILYGVFRDGFESSSTQDTAGTIAASA